MLMALLTPSAEVKPAPGTFTAETSVPAAPWTPCSTLEESTKLPRHVTQIYYTVDFGEDGARKVEGGKGSEAILSKKPWTVAAWSAYAPTILPRLLTERARVQAAPGTSTVVYFQSCRDGIRAE